MKELVKGQMNWHETINENFKEVDESMQTVGDLPIKVEQLQTSVSDIEDRVDVLETGGEVQNVWNPFDMFEGMSLEQNISTEYVRATKALATGATLSGEVVATIDRYYNDVGEFYVFGVGGNLDLSQGSKEYPVNISIKVSNRTGVVSRTKMFSRVSVASGWTTIGANPHSYTTSAVCSMKKTGSNMFLNIVIPLPFNNIEGVTNFAFNTEDRFIIPMAL